MIIIAAAVFCMGGQRVVELKSVEVNLSLPFGMGGQADHEQAWARNEELRAVLGEIRPLLEQYAELSPRWLRFPH